MTATDERQTLTQLGADHGWAQRTADRADVYTRGNIRIRVIWTGDTARSAVRRTSTTRCMRPTPASWTRFAPGSSASRTARRPEQGERGADRFCR